MNDVNCVGRKKVKKIKTEAPDKLQKSRGTKRKKKGKSKQKHGDNTMGDLSTTHTQGKIQSDRR